ncbi:DUF2207 domain-containing protein [Microbacterium sp. SSM24]|uniref:DUF2207 domain-containing protein n=1 Tax=Microbacterium sp. SSM24 TaxID=2991714 RepID=UPI002225FA2A|nr:DUF2207 domain-containing protein [Microbacterium sp. SSM24]MCW3493465.1 DUF2207 domain-containing protein [Microbacterium sp. SSM24]
MGTVSSVAARARTLTVIAFAVMLALGSVLWGGMPRALADVNDFEFESLDVVYELGRADDGTSTLTVIETFVAVFPEFDQNRGMQRRIPDSYLGAPLRPHLVSITDGDGNPREAETESDDDYYIMTSRAGDFVHGRQTYVFTYTLENVVRHFEDTGVDEFYWNVNGTEWQQPFGRVTARVTMAPEVADGLTGAQACYVGYEGSTDTCAIATVGAAVEASAGPVLPYQTMTLAIGFDPATFEEFDASYLASPWGWLQSLSALGMVGAFVWALVVRRRHLRDEPGRPVIIAEYTPPRMVDALEGAVMLGLTTKAIPAEVLEQAVVGSLRIVEGEHKFWGGVKLKAQLVDPSKADGDGRMLLEGLFPDGVPGEEFEFGRTDTRFSSAAQSILKAANQELVNRRLRREVPARVRVLPLLAAIGAAVLIFLTGFAALDGMVNPLVPILLIVGAVPATIVIGGLVARKPLTALGAETRDHLLGLKEFIEWAEADRIRMLQSPQGAERVQIDTTDRGSVLRLYETLLPYAVVFGQEKDWARELAVLYGPGASPVWYAGSGGFDASSFSSGISTLSASTASSSSTSGGSGGGGSAGGGGGGGGGGGV